MDKGTHRVIESRELWKVQSFQHCGEACCLQTGRRSERERARAKLQAADADRGVQRAPAGCRNISLRLCQRTEVSRELMRASERPRDSFSHVKVYSMGHSHGSLLRAAFTGATVGFFFHIRFVPVTGFPIKPLPWPPLINYNFSEWLLCTTGKRQYWSSIGMGEWMSSWMFTNN